MILDPDSLDKDPTKIEEIEKSSLRLVTQALFDFREDAEEIFREESDLEADIGEDITREALDKMGVSRIDQRLFGKIDYKRARYVFHSEYAVKQALFVDSKAEKDAPQVARIQTAQTSMRIRQIRAGQRLDVPGKLRPVIVTGGHKYLATTIFAKFHYRVEATRNRLIEITVACIPNGLLQDQYNPTPEDTIWVAGPNAPARGEQFRVRLSFARLRKKMPWRVQTIPLAPAAFKWRD